MVSFIMGKDNNFTTYILMLGKITLGKIFKQT